MNKNISNILAGALVTGLLAGSLAIADEHDHDAGGDKQEHKGGKDGCSGKDGCKGNHDHKDGKKKKHEEHKD